MEIKRYKPYFDRIYLMLFIFTDILVAAALIIAITTSPIAAAIMSCVLVFVNYFLLSPAFGYVELQENGVFIRFGFIMKKHIAYSSIRAVEKKRQFYADSMLSLKNALDHVNIKYNKFDVISVSVRGMDELVTELQGRAGLGTGGI